MLFNSYEFIFIFLPISFFVYFYLNSKRLTTASKAWLVFTSLFFYSWWNISYLPLILISILFNYSITSTMSEYKEKNKNYFSKKTLLLIALFFNIGLLGYFKYMDFFISNTNLALSLEIPMLNLALPLAISFFTLQQIAFVIDSYEGLVEEKNFLDYTIFVTFFPQLIAGPIVHHSEMMPQFASKWNMLKNYKNILMGIFIFSIGLFKKVVIADSFAVWANAGFNNAQSLNLIEAWATSLSYTFQMYFDFSGYTDMAIGTALLFNIKLPQNFNSPYKATSIIDFWQRWHITLTEFITTYVYTPILRSFNKLTFHKAMIATFIAMMVSGIWHGAGWTFIVWGAMHGVALIINHYWHKHFKYKLPSILAWFITFNFINITLVVFKSINLTQAYWVLNNMLFGEFVLQQKYLDKLSFLNYFDIKPGIITEHIHDGSTVLIFLILAFVISLFMKNSSQFINNKNLSYKNGFLFSLIFFISIISMLTTDYTEFLYFNF